MDAHIVEIQITCGNDREADLIAEALIARRLAACVQQLPIRSIYRWRGAVERDDEILLLAKTTRPRIEGVRATVRELHSYDVPALTVIDIADGADDYLAWISAETTPESPDPSDDVS
jgi:periplasmic divalent cation tolerance protein